jgi:1,4-alpha-glucan branching enzyme
MDKDLWITDPNNPSKIENEFGDYNSVIDIKKNVTFKLCDYLEAQTVILSGDFNDWSEDDYKMTKVDNCWVYTEKLSGGKHHYKFIMDGTWITYPENSVKEYDDEGHINSVCMVK